MYSLLLLVARVSFLVRRFLGIGQPNFAVLCTIVLVLEALAFVAVVVTLFLAPMKTLVVPTFPVMVFRTLLAASCATGFVLVVVVFITPVVLFVKEKVTRKMCWYSWPAHKTLYHLFNSPRCHRSDAS